MLIPDRCKPAVFPVLACLGALIALWGACLASTPAAAQAGTKQFVVIVNHDPARFSLALKAGRDFVAGGGKTFQIILDNRAVLLAIPGSNTVQREYLDIIRRTRGLKVIACSETMQALQARNPGRRVPVLPGVSVAKCEGLRQRLQKEGYLPAVGI
jgi:hypothetical protein